LERLTLFVHGGARPAFSEHFGSAAPVCSDDLRRMKRENYCARDKQVDVNSKSSRVLEGDFINTGTSPCSVFPMTHARHTHHPRRGRSRGCFSYSAYVSLRTCHDALVLMMQLVCRYVQSNDASVAARVAVPTTAFALDKVNHHCFHNVDQRLLAKRCLLFRYDRICSFLGY
jgi:hypothetical protein